MANDSKQTQLGWTTTVDPQLTEQAEQLRIESQQIPAPGDRASQMVFYGHAHELDPIEPPRAYSPIRALVERAIVAPSYGPSRTPGIDLDEHLPPHARQTMRAERVTLDRDDSIDGHEHAHPARTSHAGGPAEGAGAGPNPRAARAKSVGEYAVHAKRDRGSAPRGPRAPERSAPIPASDDDSALTTPATRALSRQDVEHTDRRRGSQPDVAPSPSPVRRRADVIAPGMGVSSADVRAHARAAGVDVATPIPQPRRDRQPTPSNATPSVPLESAPVPAPRARRRRADVMFPVPDDLGAPEPKAKATARPTSHGYSSLSDAYEKPTAAKRQEQRAPTHLELDVSPEILALMKARNVAAHREPRTPEHRSATPPPLPSTSSSPPAERLASSAPAPAPAVEGNYGAWIHQYEASVATPRTRTPSGLPPQLEAMRDGYDPAFLAAPTENEAPSYSALIAARSADPAATNVGSVAAAHRQASVAPISQHAGHGSMPAPLVPSNVIDHSSAPQGAPVGSQAIAYGHTSSAMGQDHASVGSQAIAHGDSSAPQGHAPVGSQAIAHGHGHVASIPSQRASSVYAARSWAGSPGGAQASARHADPAWAIAQGHAPEPAAIPMVDYGYGPVPSAGGYPGYVHVPQQGYVPSPLFAPHPAIPPAPSGRLARGSAPEMAKPSPPLRADANATVGVSDRVRFIRRTYVHLFFAIVVFGGLSWLLRTNALLLETVSDPLTDFALGGRWNWGIVLAAFVAISWFADCWASHAKSRAVQYAGLAFYVVAEALIFVPLLALVETQTRAILADGGVDPHIVRDAAIATLAIFGTLTLSVFVMRKDFSFLGGALALASGAAFALIGMSLVFGFTLGLVFSGAMVVLAGGYILIVTSRILAHHDPRHHVSAALQLFSSLALMFWYLIRIFMRAR